MPRPFHWLVWCTCAGILATEHCMNSEEEGWRSDNSIRIIDHPDLIDNPVAWTRHFGNDHIFVRRQSKLCRLRKYVRTIPDTVSHPDGTGSRHDSGRLLGLLRRHPGKHLCPGNSKLLTCLPVVME